MTFETHSSHPVSLFFRWIIQKTAGICNFGVAYTDAASKVTGQKKTESGYTTVKPPLYVRRLNGAAGSFLRKVTDA
jgi:hypothetical protein